MGFADYFLIVWDLIAFARRSGISVGPGRGSTAGSLVAYCLDITEVDPMKYDLLFERMLNPGRKSMPDIDIDFAVAGRDRVINYAAEKYGRDRVAQIITFGTMMARAAIRDAGRVLDVPYGTVDRIAKLVPEGPKVYLEDSMKPGQELKAAYDADPLVREILDLAKPLEGLVRQDSIHAAGVVIADRPLTDIVPLQQKGADQELVTQLAMGDVEALGLLKIDFLGLRNLDVIDAAVRLVGDVDIADLPLDDPATYEMLQRGDTAGVFQFESSGMREALRQVKPTEFEDLIALVALFRPGPMSYIPVYARRKAGQEAVTFADPRLEEITGSTYAICIYQEQYMEIAKQLAGFSPAEADDLRKAIGKKIHSLMASLKDKFVEGAIANGLAPDVARGLWSDMEKAQDYSFNKSHAACYALIAYRTAYLKAHHTAHYMAALISSVMNTKDRVPYYVNACDEMGIEVLPPDVNASQVDFAVVEGKIRFGLNAVKNVGEAAAQAIVAGREAEGPFVSLWDFTERVDPQLVNKRALESLVKAGALDSTSSSRKGMLDVLEHALSYGQTKQADRASGQASIFDDLPDAVDTPKATSHPEISSSEFEKAELLRLEKEALGLYVSEHPAARHPRPAAPQGRLAGRGPRAPPRRRDRDGRRHRLVGEAPDDEEGRPDGLPVARRPHRRGRGRRLQQRVRGLTGALSRRHGARRQGQGRPQAGRRDEAHRARGDSVRRGTHADRSAAEGRRAGGAGRHRPRARPCRQGLPGRGSRRRRARDVGGLANARARPRLPRAARGRLLRRGEGSARRSGSVASPPGPSRGAPASALSDFSRSASPIPSRTRGAFENWTSR